MSKKLDHITNSDMSWDQFDTRTKDDEQARRLASLSLAFINANSPLSRARIHELFYPSLQDDSFNRSFYRDRKNLAYCGLCLKEEHNSSNDSLWSVDCERSFADLSNLSSTEALAIDVACADLTHDASFPYRDELSLALAKINTSFSATAFVRKQGDNSDSHPLLATLRSCLETRTAVKVTYVNAQQQESTRLLALYGSFGFRESTYFLAVTLNNETYKEDGPVKTYRLDRFVTAHAQTRIHYEIPLDFDTRDYILLPPQIGPLRYTVSFELPLNPTAEQRRILNTYGQISDTTHEWSLQVANLTDCAAWAIDLGFTPLSPIQVVEEYKAILKSALLNNSTQPLNS